MVGQSASPTLLQLCRPFSAQSSSVLRNVQLECFCASWHETLLQSMYFLPKSLDILLQQTVTLFTLFEFGLYLYYRRFVSSAEKIVFVHVKLVPLFDLSLPKKHYCNVLIVCTVHTLTVPTLCCAVQTLTVPTLCSTVQTLTVPTLCCTVQTLTVLTLCCTVHTLTVPTLYCAVQTLTVPTLCCAVQTLTVPTLCCTVQTLTVPTLCYAVHTLITVPTLCCAVHTLTVPTLCCAAHTLTFSVACMNVMHYKMYQQPAKCAVILWLFIYNILTNMFRPDILPSSG